MRKKTVRDIDVNGKRVLVRVDYNVPLDAGKILDESRIRATLPTISYLREQQAKLILMSHLGRPKGRRDEALSLRPVAKRLGELLGGEASLRRPGVDHGDTPSPESEASLREAQVQMTDCCVGADVQRAAHSLGEGEVLLLENLRFHAEEEANDLEYAKALASLGEVYVNDAFGTAHRAHASTEGVARLLPAVAGRFAAGSPARRVSVKDVPDGWRIMDVGETTIDVFARALQDCRMVVWNGPMGVIEMPPFAHGSHRLAGVLVNLGEATTIIGGGETAAVVEQVGLASRFSHVSTGGGASLEFLEGKELPGVAVLMDA